MLTNSITKRLESDPDWQALQSHIEENIDALNSLDGIDFTDKEKAAIEGQARALAKEKLLAILEPFGAAEESTDSDKQHVSAKTGVI